MPKSPRQRIILTFRHLLEGKPLKGGKKDGTWSKLQQVLQPAQPMLKQSVPALKKLGKILYKLSRLAILPITHPVLKYVTAVVLSLSVIGAGLLLQELPSPRRLTSKEYYSVSTQIFDRHGTLLYEIFADENRVPVAVNELPPHVLQTTIAIEDKNFYRHFGFDLSGMIRAVRNNVLGEADDSLQGGSTITQQLVKNALLSSEQTLERKVKELVLAVFTEILYSKEEILGMYLNYIPYGGTAVGIEAAAQQYFNKSARDLNLSEAALLAGLPQAPSIYSPFASDPTNSQRRQQEVLRRMVEDGYITQAQADEATRQPLAFALSKTDIKAPHFVFYVRDLLYEKYGVETVEKGGLRVYTSLDLPLQDVAQASLAAELANLHRHRVSNGAAMVVKPNTGEILAMIGSRDYFDTEIDGQVNVALRPRQPGSSIKPINYATAFQEKMLNPGSILLDIPTCFIVPGQKPYCPKNYDGSFKGPVTIRKSIGNSLNIPAVKTLRIIGVETLMRQAKKMGISTWADASNYGLSLTLGGGEVKMIDMAQAFSVLANQGVKVPITPILRIEDYTGEVLEAVDFDQRQNDLMAVQEMVNGSVEGDLERVMDRAPAYLTTHIMQDNNARVEAFGARSQLVIPGQIVSAKTGTTNDLKDNWTVGFTPEFLAIVWVGNNDGSPMNPYLVSGITGAAPIWNDIMTYVIRDQEPIIPDKPSDIASGGVCATGMPPEYSKTDKETCASMYTELYWEESEPTPSKMYSKEIWIKPETGLPPAFGEQAEGLQLQQHTVYQDPLTPAYCADCQRAVDEEGKIIYEQQNVTHNFILREENGL